VSRESGIALFRADTRKSPCSRYINLDTFGKAGRAMSL